MYYNEGCLTFFDTDEQKKIDLEIKVDDMKALCVCFVTSLSSQGKPGGYWSHSFPSHLTLYKTYYEKVLPLPEFYQNYWSFY